MWLMLAACRNPTPPVHSDDDSGKQVTSPGLGCDEQRTPLGFDEDGPLGLSAADGLTAVMGTFSSVLVYREGGQSPLTLTTVLAAAELVVQTPAGTGEETTCDEPRVSALVDVGLVTQDHLFDEHFSFDVTVVEVLAALPMNVYLEVSELGGTFAGTNTQQVSVNGTFRSGGTSSGELVEIRGSGGTGSGTGTGTGGTECGIGSWGGPLMTGCE